MKPLPLLILFLACAGCTNFPELEGREQPDVKSARYPKLIPLQENLGPPIDPVNEAAEVEEDLLARREALQKKSEELQNVEID
ncbi:hypothetical protein [Ruegeria meonggei]|uniref:Uncharacterized protein n=1 Tax=Ruegeria meonggei TaxID=1446476 RepID=A0A1X6YU14_9RHOB|nr:hypothetical protein [Ruegeria meonggei]SLN31433.1 hypothetical protein RUM8411_01310 [Ruegeria meonggei]